MKNVSKLFVLLGIVFFVFSNIANGQIFIWNLNANGSWNVNGNWDVAGFPNAVGDTATFGNVITANRTITLGQNVTVGTLNIQDNNRYTITGANTLTFDVAAGNAALNVNRDHIIQNSVTILLNDDLDFTNSTTNNFRIRGAIQGTGGITVTGGRLTFQSNGINTYTGDTIVQTGQLRLNRSGTDRAIAGNLTIGDGIGAAGSALVDYANRNNQISNTSLVTILSDGRLDLTGENETIGSLASASTGAQVFLGGGNLIMGDASNTTFAGVISENGTITKQGNGTLTLTNNNTYSGTTTVNNGILSITNGNALGNTSNGTTVNSGGTLDLSGGITVTNEDLDLNGTGEGGVGALRSFSGCNTWDGDITLSGNSTITSNTAATILTLGATSADSIATGGNALTLDGAGDTTINSIISGGGGSLVKNGNGTAILNSNNTYTGATTINNGILSITNAGALGTTATGTTVNSGGTIQISGGITVVGEALSLAGTGEGGVGALRNLSGNNTWNADVTLSGSATVTSNTAGTTLTFGSDTNDSVSIGANTLTLDGAGDMFFNSQINGTGNLVKNGTGTTELNWGGVMGGPHSVHTGTTQINAGTLISNVGDSATQPTLTGTITVGDGVGTDTFRTQWLDQIADTTTVNVNSSGILEVSAAQEDAFLGGNLNETIGALNLEGGALVTTTNGATNDAFVVLNGNVTRSTTGNTAATISGNLSLGGSTRIFNIADNATATTELTVSAVTIDGGASSGITKTGAGVLELSAANTFTGITTINAGTVKISADNNLGTAPGAAAANQLTLNGGTLNTTATFGLNANRGITLGASGGTIEVDNGTTLTGNSIITGTGNLTKTGSGTLSLAASNDYTGSTNVTSGTLNLAGTSALTATSAVNLTGGTLLLGSDSDQINNSATLTLAGGNLGTMGFDETLNTLTLSADSAIALNGGNSILTFADSSAEAWTASTVLTITDWDGWFNSGGGNDQILFGSASGLTGGQVDQVYFLNPGGIQGFFSAQLLASGEIIPVMVPEPSTFFSGFLILGTAGVHFWQRRRRLDPFPSEKV